eukprot:GEZU01035948.1.p1 GENE.GEZU01035948.1~~GEZU01035948.1.p1  ORF type:complete len:206 (-),score=49.91 GEZU01035948.1:124-741(-)
MSTDQTTHHHPPEHIHLTKQEINQENYAKEKGQSFRPFTHITLSDAADIASRSDKAGCEFDELKRRVEIVASAINNPDRTVVISYPEAIALESGLDKYDVSSPEMQHNLKLKIMHAAANQLRVPFSKEEVFIIRQLAKVKHGLDSLAERIKDIGYDQYPTFTKEDARLLDQFTSKTKQHEELTREVVHQTAKYMDLPKIPDVKEL